MFDPVPPPPIATPVTIAPIPEFRYQPPPAAIAATRILVKPNLGYPVGPPVTVGMTVLGEVLRSLRAASPQAEILVVEGVCSPVSLPEIATKLGLDGLLDPGMALLDADTLPQTDYPNRRSPQRFRHLSAPRLLQEVDCCISVGTFKRTVLNDRPLISAALKNLYGLLPRDRYRARSPHSRGQLHRPSVPAILEDVYGCLGHWFSGAVVDGSYHYVSPDWKPDRARAGQWRGQVIFGEDLLSVDRAACEVMGEAIAPYLLALTDPSLAQSHL
jgi:hypothetical protein